MTDDGYGDVAGEEVAVDVDVTLADQLRFNDLILSSPSVRRRRRLRVAAGVLLLPALGLSGGAAVGWLTDAHRDPLPETLRSLWPYRAEAALAWLCCSGAFALVAAALRLTRRPRLRRNLRRLLRERVGVDPADPALRQRAHCTFGPDGSTTRGMGGDVRVAWVAFRALDETDDLFVVRTGSATGFLLPRRGMTDGQQAAIRRVVAANLAKQQARSPHAG